MAVAISVHRRFRQGRRRPAGPILVRDELVAALPIHDAERVELGENLVNQAVVGVLVERHQGLRAVLAHQRSLGYFSAVRKQPVVEQSAVVHVMVRGVLHSSSQQAPEHALHLRRSAEEKLHGRGQKLKAHVIVVGEIGVAIDERLQDVRRFLGLGAVLPDNPHDRSPSLRLADASQHFAERRQDIRPPFRVLPQQIPHCLRRLRLHVVHIKVQELQHLVKHDADPIRQSQADLRDRPDAPARHFRIRVADHLGQLANDVRKGSVGGDGGQHVHLDELDRRRFVEARIKLSVVGIKDAGTAVDQGANVLENAEAHFIAAPRHEREQRSLHPFVDLPVQVGHVLRQVNEAFHARQDHAAVAGTEDGIKEVHDVEGLVLVRRLVARHEVEHLTEAPLVEVRDAVEEVQDDGLIDCHPAILHKQLVQDHNAVADNLGKPETGKEASKRSTR
eukprot:scaffold109_cov252-Pinguiococcus_pyrenoidosus.AAC.104